MTPSSQSSSFTHLQQPKVNNLDLEAIARRHLDIKDGDIFEIFLLSQGASCAPLYRVIKNERFSADLAIFTADASLEYITGISATMLWLRQNTTIPLPFCITSFDDEVNELEYNWILTTSPSLTLAEPRGLSWAAQDWKPMPMNVKEHLIKDLALCHSQALLPRNRFKSGCSGSICYQLDSKELFRQRLGGSHSKKLAVGPCMRWCYGAMECTSHGPLSSVLEWLKPRLDDVIKVNERIMAQRDETNWYDNIRMEEDAAAITLAGRLIEKIPFIFPAEVYNFQETVLWNPYFSLYNLMVDSGGKLAAIDKIQKVKLAPVWSRYQLPYMLCGPDREEKPVMEHYDVDAQSNDSHEVDCDSEYDYDEDDDPEAPFPYGSPENRISYLYRTHLEEYERTKLRKVYLETMEVLQPGFQQTMKQYELLADFEAATMRCGDVPDGTRAVKKWLDALEAGKPYCLVRNMKAYKPWHVQFNE